MTDEELRTLVASLAVSTANNATEARTNTEAIRELRATVETQGRVMTDGFATLRESVESQARNIETMREGMTYNTDIMANAMKLAALSQRTAAEAMELSANTARNLDHLRNDINEMKQMLGIVISDNKADRGRITKLEEP